VQQTPLHPTVSIGHATPGTPLLRRPAPVEIIDLDEGPDTYGRTFGSPSSSSSIFEDNPETNEPATGSTPEATPEATTNNPIPPQNQRATVGPEGKPIKKGMEHLHVFFEYQKKRPNQKDCTKGDGLCRFCKYVSRVLEESHTNNLLSIREIRRNRQEQGLHPPTWQMEYAGATSTDIMRKHLATHHKIEWVRECDEKNWVIPLNSAVVHSAVVLARDTIGKLYSVVRSI
jgi:hypothetical protein